MKLSFDVGLLLTMPKCCNRTITSYSRKCTHVFSETQCSHHS